MNASCQHEVWEAICLGSMKEKHRVLAFTFQMLILEVAPAGTRMMGVPIAGLCLGVGAEGVDDGLQST